MLLTGLSGIVLIGITSITIAPSSGSALVIPILLLILVIGTAIFLNYWPRSALFLIIASVLLNRYRAEIGPVSVRAEHVVAIVVLFIGSARLFIELGRIWLPRPTALLFAWWGANLLAALTGPDLMLGLQNAVRLAIMVTVCLLVINLIPDYSTWRWAITVFLALGVAEASYGILTRFLYEFGINLGLQIAYRLKEPVPYGTLEEGNIFGSQCAVWAIIIFSVILGKNSFREKLPWIIVFFITSTATILSMSRAAWIMLLAGICIIWMTSPKNVHFRFMRFLLAAIAFPVSLLLLLLFSSFMPNIPIIERIQSFSNLKNDYTWSARLSDWSLAWQGWLERPFFGWGPGSFLKFHGLLRFNRAWISNLTLRLLQESGIVGLLSFFLFFTSAVLTALRTSFRCLPDEGSHVLRGLAVSYIVLIGLAYQSTDGIWLASAWVHAGLIISGIFMLSQTKKTFPLIASV